MTRLLLTALLALLLLAPAAHAAAGDTVLSDERTVSRHGYANVRAVVRAAPDAGREARRPAPVPHRGRPARGLPRAAQPPRRRRRVAPDPPSRPAQRPHGLDPARRARPADQAHHLLRGRPPQAARHALRGREADLALAHRRRRARHPDAEGPLLHPPAPAQPGRQPALRALGLRNERVLRALRLAGRRRRGHPRHEPAASCSRAASRTAACGCRTRRSAGWRGSCRSARRSASATGAGRAWSAHTARRADRRLHALPGLVRLVQDPAPRDQRGGAGLLARMRRLPRAHPAQVGAGRRHAVRRRRRHGAPCRRRRGRAARPLRRGPGRRPASAGA